MQQPKVNPIRSITLSLIYELSSASLIIKKSSYSNNLTVSKIKEEVDDKALYKTIANAKTAYSVECTKANINFEPFFKTLKNEYANCISNLNNEIKSSTGTKDSVLKCGLDQIENYKEVLNTVSLNMEALAFPSEKQSVK